MLWVGRPGKRPGRGLVPIAPNSFLMVTDLQDLHFIFYIHAFTASSSDISAYSSPASSLQHAVVSNPWSLDSRIYLKGYSFINCGS
jgi:hypothetical protein